MKDCNAFWTKRTHAEKRRSHELISESPKTFGNSDLDRVGVTVEWENDEIIDSPSPTHSNDKPTLEAVDTAPVSATPVEFSSPTPSLYSSSVYSIPSSFYPPTPSPPSIIPTSPVIITTKLEPDCAHHYGEILPSDLNAELNISIGELGKRRGFKGAPLFTQATNNKTSFLWLPSTFSPRNATPRTPTSRTPSPRTPLTTVTNFIRAPRSAKTPAYKYKAVSPGLQDFYDRSDPFATSADSFFSSEVSFAVVPTVNLDNFDPYHYGDTICVRTPSLKRKPDFQDLQAASSTRKHVTEMTVYDMPVYDIPSKKTEKPVTRPKINISRTQREMSSSPAIILIPPSAPPSPSKMHDIVEVIIPAPDNTVILKSSGSQEWVQVQAQDSTHLEDRDAYFPSDFSSPPVILTSNFYDFGPYHESPISPTKRSPSLKGKPCFSDLQNASPTKATKLAEMETNIYDWSVSADDDNLPVSWPAFSTVPLDIVSAEDLFPPPTPLISPINNVDDPAGLQVGKSRGCRNANPAPFEADAVALEKASSYLRPLVLPLRLASRNSFTSSMTSPCHLPALTACSDGTSSLDDLVSDAPKVNVPVEPGSTSLDDLIVLLDAIVFDFVCKEAREDVMDDTQCDKVGYCDPELLSEGYAI